MHSNQLVFNTSAGVAGAMITYLFGGWSPLLGLLLFVIILDYASGIAAAVIEGTGLNSEVGLKGLIKKFAMVAIVALAYRIDVVMETDIIMAGAVWFFVANELISITENYGRMKLPMPDKLKNIIEVLKGRGGL